MRFWISTTSLIWKNNPSYLVYKSMEEFVEWEEILNLDGINWQDDKVVLVSSNKKITCCKIEENETFYFIRTSFNVSPLSTNGKEIYQMNFSLDYWQTIFLSFYKFLETNKCQVFVKRGYCNRLITYNSGTGCNFNLIRQNYLSQLIPIKNEFSYEKKLLSFTTEEKILLANEISPSENVVFVDEDGTQEDIPLSKFSYRRTVNNRYTYLKVRGSSVVVVSGTGSNKTILPKWESGGFDLILTLNEDFLGSWYRQLFWTREDLLNLPNGTYFNIAGDNFIGLYQRDIPYTIFYEKVGSRYHYVRNGVDIYFAQVEQGWSLDFILYNYTSLHNNLFGKLMNVINGLISKTLSPDTEPLFLNPLYYREEYKVDDGKILFIDSSLINLDVDSNIDTEKFYLQGKAIFEVEGVLFWDFGDFTNYLNPFWNNTFSSLRVSDSVAVGINSTALSNYATNNVSSLYTSQQNLIQGNANRTFNMGMGIAKSLTNMVGSMVNLGSFFESSSSSGLTVDQTINNTVARFMNPEAEKVNKAVGTELLPKMKEFSGSLTSLKRGLGVGTPISNLTSMISSGFDIASSIVNNNYQNQLATREFQKGISNISSSPSTTLGVPYINQYFENKKGLFELYSKELNSYDKLAVFNDLLSNGYVINTYLDFLSLRNREIANVLDLDLTLSNNLIYKYWRNYWENMESSIFRDDYYCYLFISSLSNSKYILWEDNEVVNIFNFGYVINDEIIRSDDYYDNCEKIRYSFITILYLDNVIPDNLLINYYLFYQQENIRETFLEQLLSSYLTNLRNLTYDWYENYVVVRANDDNETYKGSKKLIFKYQRKPVDLGDFSMLGELNSIPGINFGSCLVEGTTTTLYTTFFNYYWGTNTDAIYNNTDLIFLYQNNWTYRFVPISPIVKGVFYTVPTILFDLQVINHTPTTYLSPILWINDTIRISVEIGYNNRTTSIMNNKNRLALVSNDSNGSSSKNYLIGKFSYRYINWNTDNIFLNNMANNFNLLPDISIGTSFNPVITDNDIFNTIWFEYARDPSDSRLTLFIQRMVNYWNNYFLGINPQFSITLDGNLVNILLLFWK